MGYTPPYLEVRKVTGGWTMYPPGATTDDLTIYPNGTDTTSAIKINGLGVLYLYANSTFNLIKGTTDILDVGYATPDVTVTCPIADKNISLVTTGTGTVKFGTFTGTGDLATNGYITITDSGGTARRLAVVP